MEVISGNLDNSYICSKGCETLLRIIRNNGKGKNDYKCCKLFYIDNNKMITENEGIYNVVVKVMENYEDDANICKSCCEILANTTVDSNKNSNI